MSQLGIWLGTPTVRSTGNSCRELTALKMIQLIGYLLKKWIEKMKQACDGNIKLLHKTIISLKG